MSRITMSILLEYGGAANRLAYIMDPDTGGADTFHYKASETGLAPATAYYVDTYMSAEYQALLETKNPALIMEQLSILATERDRPQPEQDDVDVFCEYILLGEEVTVKLIQDQG